MSLKAYSNIDAAEHKRISNILSHHQSFQPPSQQYHESTARPSNALSSSAHSLPQFSFSNCTVYFDSSHMPHGSAEVPPVKKCKIIID